MNGQRLFGIARAVPTLISMIAVAAPAHCQPRAIDPARSTLTVRVYKTGVLSAFGHDHEITAPVASGHVDASARRMELRVAAAALRVRDPNTPEKDRAEIQKTMAGPEVLDVGQYPEIAFHAASAEPAGANSWTVRGELTLRGQTHPVTVQVREQDGHYVGDSRFRQSEFGIRPIRIAGGTVKVKDEVRVEFDIQLLQ